MPTALLICIKAATGGVFVALFAVLGEILHPKRFAGIFGASPAVALANLAVTALGEGVAAARTAASGMIAGAIALLVACVAAIPAVRRWGAVRGSAVIWGVWAVAAAAAALPLATVAGASMAGVGAAGAGGGGGLRSGRKARQGPKTGTGAAGGRLFGADPGGLRGIRPRELVLRFVFGAAISVMSGLIGVAAGKFAGGVLLAAPAVLPATLTIIEKQEGLGAAVTEVRGSVPGAIALIGFAVVAAASTARLPLAASLACALATWLAAAVGGYLAQATVLPAWRDDVRSLARQRYETALAARSGGG